MLKTYLVIMLGGALGTGLRFGLTTLCTSRYGDAFPVGTLAVNVLGCLVIGWIAAWTGPEGSTLWRPFIMIGILGGFTTFSAFSLQTFTLLTNGQWWWAGLNVVLSVGLCLVAVWLGHWVALALYPRSQ